MEYRGLGKKIRKLRKNKGWSKEKFAGKADIDVDTLVRIETEVTRNIPRDMLYRIARAFYMDIDDLVRDL
jgi:transcriptional regulator with XRE-family HTH domain